MPRTRTTAPRPPANRRPVTVCVPDDIAAGDLTDQTLHRLGVTGILDPRLPTTAAHRWQRRHLTRFQRHPRPARCAGGPIRLLDLTGLRRHTAALAAHRHRLWTHTVTGTRPAQPWTTFQARHQANPTRYHLEAATAEFWAQPRINAMRLHNTLAPPTDQIPIGHVEVLQAGPAAYQHYCATSAVTGDAVHTLDGATIAPAGDDLAHRISYLDQAHHYLTTLDPGQRLLAALA